MRERMADLLFLLQDLGDRIASKSEASSCTQAEDDDPVESRFRSVLPSLLDTYFVPSKVKGRELMAILKLLSHTVKHYPGVFFHGKCRAVLPIVGHIIPLFAEQELRACHGGLFDTLCAFLNLLRAGDREIYLNFFIDGMLLVEDLLSVSSFYSSVASFSSGSSVSIQCYVRSFSDLYTDGDGEHNPPPLCQVPDGWKPLGGPGLLINVTGDTRWQSLTEWTMTMLARCLGEGALHVEGLLTPSFITVVGSLLCYGDSSVQKACFEFIRIATSVMDAEAFPTEKLIHSIAIILTLNDGKPLPFRTAAYDSAMGACLVALCSSCQSGSLECIAEAITDILRKAIQNTSSQELKVAVCDSFSIILKHCPCYVEKLPLLLELIVTPGISSSIFYCIQLAFNILGPERVLGKSSLISTEVSRSLGLEMGVATRQKIIEGSGSEQLGLHAEVYQIRCQKRRRLDAVAHDVRLEHAVTSVQTKELNNLQIVNEKNAVKVDSQDAYNCKLSEEERNSLAKLVQDEIKRILKVLKPNEIKADFLTVEGRLEGLGVFTRLFANFSGACFNHLMDTLGSWILWMQDKRQSGHLTMIHLSMFLEVLEGLLPEQGSYIEACGCHCRGAQLLKDLSAAQSFIVEMLLLPWSQLQGVQENLIDQIKCRALRIASKIGTKPGILNTERVFECAFKDEVSHVRTAAVKALPGLLVNCHNEMIPSFLDIIRDLGDDNDVQVREAVANVLGVMVCIHDSNLSQTKTGGACVDSSETVYKEHSQPTCFNCSFVCPVCDSGEYDEGKHNEHVSALHLKAEGNFSAITSWEPLFVQLLFEKPSELTQVAFIGSMSRLLQHSTINAISAAKVQWLQCLDVLPLHHHRSVREAFCSQIKYFTNKRVLLGLFGGEEDISDTDRELKMLGKLRHALCEAEDPDVQETIMETVAEIANYSSHRRQLFFFSLVLLLEQLDNKHLFLRVKSVKLIQETAKLGWPSPGNNKVQNMVEHIKEELFEYLSCRLLARPSMIQEFAEAVVGVESVDLIKQMVPVILPKLVLDQQHSQQALDILHELSRQLETDLPLLLLEWCHKVLSVLLLRADGKELMAALQFYEAQTGSDPREIFAAVLPALLDELVRFLGDTETEENQRRSVRVAPMIQEVASIVTGSDDLPTFLRSHFVGLLNSIDRKLLRTEDVASQKQALRCIERLVDMIGPHLSAFVPKIMALLTQALQGTCLQLEGLKVWLSFVRTLGKVSPANLKYVASQILVSLMPCLEAENEEEQKVVVLVLEELVVKNRAVLDDQARELPLLPSLPCLTKVNAVLHEARGLLSFRDQLRRAADGLHHESMSVRCMTASELKKLMRAQRRNLTAMLVGEATIDAEVISTLVAALLRGCAEESRTVTSHRLRMASAECLGELGAVDPVKLQVNLRQRSRIERSDEDLVFELINEHLTRVLRAASDTDVQDAAALAIQELLKLSGCQAALIGRIKASPGSVKSKDAVVKILKKSAKNTENAPMLAESGDRLWKRFSQDVKEIITPCLTSKYLLKKSGVSMPPGPIFRSGMSFRRWMYLWIRRLVSHATGYRAEIFLACIGVVRHDMGTALYLLPYLVLNVICDGFCEAHTFVTDEILAVLAEATSASMESLQDAERGLNNSRNWSGPSEVSTQTVFTLLDNLRQWLDDCKQTMTHGQSSQGTGGSSKESSSNFSSGSTELALQCENVEKLCAAIPKQALAGASFRCQAHARALLYFETHVRDSSGALNPTAASSGMFSDEDVTFLLEIYSGLDEPDGLCGLSRLRKTNSLQDQVLINEKAGNWAEALTCCEQALQMEPNSVVRHSGVLDCLLNMGHLQAMVTHVDGLILRMPEYKREWSMRAVQAAWRLGQWDLLEEYVHNADSDGPLSTNAEGNAAFDISMAKVLQALHKRDHNMFAEQLMHAKEALLAPLAAASMESYSRAYPLVVKLHILQELENFSSLVAMPRTTENNHLAGNMMELVEDWEKRIKITQPSLWTREPILAVRRLVFNANEMQSEVGNCWLQYAKLCRAAGHYETANRAILQAQSAGAPNAHMEMAKLLWDTKKSHRAITELQQALCNVSLSVIGNAFEAALGGLLHMHGQSPLKQSSIVKPGPDVRDKLDKGSSQARRDEDLETAKTLLLLARWVHHTGQKQKEDVLSLYNRVRELQPKWEKGYFYMAKYCDDVLVDARQRQEGTQDDVAGDGSLPRRHLTVDDKPWWNYLPDVILFYAKGLHKGHCRLFQALPRLLTLWFEFGSSSHGEPLSSNKAMKAIHGRVMGIMRGCLKDLPSYQWLTSLSQLVSRICHHNDEVVRLVKHIITGVLQAYPQQALWTMAAVSKSTVAARREAAAEIIHQARNSPGQERDRVLFSQFAGLIDQMIRLCLNPSNPKAKTISLATEFGYLKRMMPVGVIMPVQRALTVTLPADGLTDNQYNPFPAGDFSTISSIVDEIEVLASLQRPKKVVLVGSDGTEHPFLCKPKDDLRKDARMMEFTTMINRLLSKDPKSRRRKLYIRTFAVIPLTEDCGMIEWVLHTRGLRHILQDIYVALGRFDRQKTNPGIKRLYDQQQQAQKSAGSGKISEADMFRTKILPMFPPVFHRWFLNTFPEPAAWFQARVAYAHTTAVWSMVGHIVGLGDRHGENILFDSTTGDCVHVDFSCLFDKGLQLEKPELVPFRLTQNMIDGLGITGYEGVFLRVSEITLSVLRTHRETLMSVLETFIHDPLVEWTKSHKSSGTEVQNPHAQRAISNIKARLQGVVVGVGAAPSLPLSVEGQAHRLIAEAISHQNLGKMYIWWMAWF